MFRSFLIAVLLIALSACSTFAPRTSVTVYPAAQTAPVVASTMEAAPIVATTTAPVNPANPLALPEPLPEFVIDPEEHRCLAQAMYFEARGEGTRGMLAVGFVVHNRVNSNKFKPKTYCGIVRDGRYVNGRIVRNACQFSFYCDGRPDRIADPATFALATDLAYDILQGEARNPVGPSLYFHERSVSWRYSAKLKRITRVGNHIFYA